MPRGQHEGWTKMEEGSWRHDSVGSGQNKLNIYEYKKKKNRGRTTSSKLGDHMADMSKNQRPENGYAIVYSDNESMRGGNRILAKPDKKKSAIRRASKIMEKNPNSKP